MTTEIKNRAIAFLRKMIEALDAYRLDYQQKHGPQADWGRTPEEIELEREARAIIADADYYAARAADAAARAAGGKERP